MASNSILAKLAVMISGDTAGLNRSLGQSQKALTTFQKGASAVSNQLAGVLAGLSFAALGREIIAVTSEFQKFEAVLTNTLGSGSAAQKALELIRDFAAKTPFSVQELTSSFVKLANQGFQPTRDEMRKLGDLAASTGKSFDQLTEAIIDAQTGEFERLKEFGIRASKAGDQVKFTFKGVQTQTDFTADSIREYLLSLGDLEGVSGSMGAISETLGGKISNLGDSFDNLLLTLGNLTSGPLTAVIDLFNEALESLVDLATEDKVTSRLEAVNDLYVETAKSVEDVSANLEKLKRLQKTEQNNYDTATEKLGSLNNQLGLSSEEYLKLAQEQFDAKQYVDAYSAAIEALTQKMTGLNTKMQEQRIALIPALNAEIKQYEQLKNQAFDPQTIGRYNVEIQRLREELEYLNATGNESGFLKNLEAQQSVGITPEIKDPSVLPEVTNPFPTVLDVDIEPYKQKLAELSTLTADYHVDQETKTAQAIARQQAIVDAQERTNQSAMQFGETIGRAFGEAAAGQISFKDAMKRTTGEILKMFLQRALAGVIAGATTTPAPPPVILALAAAGMAGISALFSSIGASGGGGGGGSTSTVPRAKVDSHSPLPSRSSEISQVEFVIHGNDLVSLTNSQNNKNGRLRG